MTTQSYADGISNGIAFPLIVKLAGALSASNELSESLQKARAKTEIKRLLQRLSEMKLRASDVEAVMSSPKGKTLERLPDGLPLLSLLHAAALFLEGQAHRVASTLGPAKRARSTSAAAFVFEALAFAYQGNDAVVDALVEDVAQRGDQKLLDFLVFVLLSIVIGRGLDAVMLGEGRQLQAAAERYIAVGRNAEAHGCPVAMDKAMRAVAHSIAGDNEAALAELEEQPAPMPGGAPVRSRALASDEMPGQTQEGLAAEARAALEEFALLVRLLSIKDPFEGWKALGEAVSEDWPEGLSPVEGIRRERE